MGGLIDVQAVRRGKRVCVVITDHGIGIPSAAYPHLFQRFYRAGNVDALQISGFGIGLHVVNEIVNLHGGEIELVSAEGEGSTFTVWLPVLRSAHNDDNG